MRYDTTCHDVQCFFTNMTALSVSKMLFICKNYLKSSSIFPCISLFGVYSLFKCHCLFYQFATWKYFNKVINILLRLCQGLSILLYPPQGLRVRAFQSHWWMQFIQYKGELFPNDTNTSAQCAQLIFQCCLYDLVCLNSYVRALTRSVVHRPFHTIPQNSFVVFALCFSSLCYWMVHIFAYKQNRSYSRYSSTICSNAIWPKVCGQHTFSPMLVEF